MEDSLNGAFSLRGPLSLKERCPTAKEIEELLDRPSRSSQQL